MLLKWDSCIIIDSQQIDDALSKNDRAKKQWIFDKIIEGEYLYEGLRIDSKRILEIKGDVEKYLNKFTPRNKYLFDTLFPNWKSIESETKVILVIGCPKMYDMMVRNNTMIIDVQNIDKYLINDYSLDDLLQLLLSHESVHMCINEGYSSKKNMTYLEQLYYILFQEGFAHAIPYIHTFHESDQEKLDDYFNKNYEKLKIAIKESDSKKQKQYLIDADTGEYWEKYGAISSKLYILFNLDKIDQIYKQGPLDFHKKIIAYKEYYYKVQ